MYRYHWILITDPVHKMIFEMLHYPFRECCMVYVPVPVAGTYLSSDGIYLYSIPGTRYCNHFLGVK